MTHVLDAAWMLTKAFSYRGLVVALSGVAIFGSYFVRINAVAGQSEVSTWRGNAVVVAQEFA